MIKIVKKKKKIKHLIYMILSFLFNRHIMRHMIISLRWKLMMIVSSIFLTLNTVFGSK